MIGIYFSGTGNSKYATEFFLKEYAGNVSAFAIEEPECVTQIRNHDELVFAYPVQYSDVPKIVKDFIRNNQDVWQGKKIFVIATMAMFSGDGAGVLARMLKKYGARITGGLHLQMADSIADEKVLKRSFEKNKHLLERANSKIKNAVAGIRNGKYPKEGLSMIARTAGFLSQRLWFGHRTETYSDQLKVDTDKCIGCAKCVRICPTGNIMLAKDKAKGMANCTVCYRCVNLCPKKAITILGKEVINQTVIEKYLK